jgi:hypothetical protein
MDPEYKKERIEELKIEIKEMLKTLRYYHAANIINNNLILQLNIQLSRYHELEPNRRTQFTYFKY